MIGALSPLERDGPNGLRADRLQTVGVGDDLVADQDLPWSGVVGDPGRNVDRAAEVVAVLEHHRAAVQADPAQRQATRGTRSTNSNPHRTPCAGSGKWNITPSPSSFTGRPPRRWANSWTISTSRPARSAAAQQGRLLAPETLQRRDSQAQQLVVVGSEHLTRLGPWAAR